MEKTRKHHTQEVPAPANVCTHKLQVKRLLKGLEHRVFTGRRPGLAWFLALPGDPSAIRSIL